MAMTRRRVVTPEGFSRDELLSLPPAVRLTEIGLRLYVGLLQGDTRGEVASGSDQRVLARSRADREGVHIAVVMLSQLNRESEKRMDKRLHIADLRGRPMKCRSRGGGLPADVGFGFDEPSGWHPGA